jgi:predicted adenylyl cyclase CyaB
MIFNYFLRKRTLMIEVEIKCQLTPEQEATLLKDAAFMSEEHITDVYYDTPTYDLSIKDYWLRTRNGTFALKIPAPTTSTTAAQRYELDTEQDIRRELKLSTDIPLEQAIRNAGYKPLYTLQQHRRKYTKEGFTIDLDHATFENFSFDRCEIETLVKKPKDVDQATKTLIAFAHRHNITPLPMDHHASKLATLIKMVNPHHFALLEKAHTRRSQ